MGGVAFLYHILYNRHGRVSQACFGSGCTRGIDPPAVLIPGPAIPAGCHTAALSGIHIIILPAAPDPSENRGSVTVSVLPFSGASLHPACLLLHPSAGGEEIVHRLLGKCASGVISPPIRHTAGTAIEEIPVLSQLSPTGFTGKRGFDIIPGSGCGILPPALLQRQIPVFIELKILTQRSPFLKGTGKSTLYVGRNVAVSFVLLQLIQFAGLCQGRCRSWKGSIFIYCVIHTQRIFYSMVQNQRMCRNFSDIQMSVRQ